MASSGRAVDAEFEQRQQGRVLKGLVKGSSDHWSCRETDELVHVLPLFSHMNSVPFIGKAWKRLAAQMLACESW